jgi:hypothetical protein
MITVDKAYISRMMLLEVYAEKHLSEEKIIFFSRKYQKTFLEFELELHGEDKEDFDRFDDYLEWKAYQHHLDEIKATIKELKSENIRVA